MSFIQNYDDLPMNWVGDWAGRRAALTLIEPPFTIRSPRRLTPSGK